MKNDDNNYEKEEILIENKPNENLLPNSLDTNKIFQQKEKFTQKKIIIILITIMIILFATGIALSYLAVDLFNNNKSNKEDDDDDNDPNKIPIPEKYYFDPNEVIQNYNFDKKDIKLGIISDFQLNSTNLDYQRNLEITLKKMKNESVDIIIMAGDIVNTGYPYEFELYKSLFNKVYTNDTIKPLVFEIMGNHEYYNTKYRRQGYYLKKNIQLFKDNFKKYPFYHVKINSFHFIFWSMQNYDTREIYELHTSWLQKHIEIAESDIKHKGDPVFIVTHAPPKYTVYGSEDDSGLMTTFNVLKKYENIFCISGHSHRSLRNEKSIWQSEFTAINTQSIAYAALSYNFTNNNDVVRKSVDSYMGYIAILDEEQIDIHRYFFHINKEIDSWTVKFPLMKNNFDFTDDKRRSNWGIPKIWNNTIEIKEIEENIYQIKYYQAWHDLAIHSYIFKYKNKNKQDKVLYIYGDYYLYNYTNNSTEPKYFYLSDIDIYENYSLAALDFFKNMAIY